MTGMALRATCASLPAVFEVVVRRSIRALARPWKRSSRVAAQWGLLLDIRDSSSVFDGPRVERPRTRPMNERPLQVVAPNLTRRLSGVSSTLARVLKAQANEIAIVSVGAKLLVSTPSMRLSELMILRNRPPSGGFRVWHARRNIEMLIGVILRDCFRFPLRLVFTSASQRKHTTWTRFLIGRMDCLVAASPQSASYLHHPAIVVPHGIDTNEFSPPSCKTLARQTLGLPDLQLVGCFGRIRSRKGSDVFVDALIPILEQRSDVGAILVGRATSKHRGFEEALRAKIRSAGLENRFLILQEVSIEQMPLWYRALSIYVAPQRWEGFGVTPLEAMATGVPVVATTVGAFPSIVTPETGLLVPPSNSNAMGDAVAELLDSPITAAAMGLAGRQRAVSEFSIEREARRLN